MVVKEVYFVYGFNMNLERMREWKVFFILWVGVKLFDYKFSFLFKRFDGYGFGNIILEKNLVVYGVLYRFDDGGLDKLDVFEKVKMGCYWWE